MTYIDSAPEKNKAITISHAISGAIIATIAMAIINHYTILATSILSFLLLLKNRF